MPDLILFATTATCTLCIATIIITARHRIQRAQRQLAELQRHNDALRAEIANVEQARAAALRALNDAIHENAALLRAKPIYVISGLPMTQYTLNPAVFARN